MTTSSYRFSRMALLLTGLTAVAACASGPDPEAASVSHMYAHYAQVGEIHEAVVNATVDDTRSPARWLSTHRGDEFPAEAQATLETMRSEARIIAEQRDLGDIGRSLARMGVACGSCHTTLGGGPSITVGEPPPHSQGMERHAWGADRLWEGLIGPSDVAWRAGGGALRSVHMDFGSNDQAERLFTRMVELASQAPEASTPKERAALYGDLLETCSLCHGALQMRIR